MQVVDYNGKTNETITRDRTQAGWWGAGARLQPKSIGWCEFDRRVSTDNFLNIIKANSSGCANFGPNC